MGASLTVADSKRAFHQAFPYVIAPLYRRLVDELLVELHLLSRQKGFARDALFATGLTQVFDSFAKGYRPESQQEPLFVALCASAGFDAAEFRREREAAVQMVGKHSLEEVRGWLSAQGEGAPEPIAGVLEQVKRPDFHYSRLFAVGLLSLLQQAQGAGSLEPQALQASAHEISATMGLLKERVDKDLSLYAGNLEKMAQAVELMEETVAADRRRRQRQAEELTARQEVSAKAATETPALSGEGAASEASETSPSSEPAAPSASR
ncbi:photosystem II biogenesis protein Psp29 [Synechococcus sp. CS-602]|uniref:photosystem II biogenesis protein Psp29 n=1 Tax=Synechococcaceae TaxID=1890426 RepID=UPI0008FF16A5|nr:MULTISPECIES: photosystem II biogenesis protein Psp29 [Synechococcaceae]MCT4364296.1 photosystem II biogenesis protein Psp29 [Candidatus Regnicoccus frigidus MAG-AL1]APD48898.1 photosystem II biogenesis protein Psp29 [Synechococcus sp. SynAce01]MCT0203744.1 photosystem II biogenesis protein Psp29 [Synechococcus sp. CS-602]MCT0246433.1 photosystem II biogenesis protein Psp29 [Synechococcus sp. CS-601]MCT4368803.1 photosystem II biogenesis protein Psp29 [Candidatus Regnicoccus frigidus MAG-AL